MFLMPGSRAGRPPTARYTVPQHLTNAQHGLALNNIGAAQLTLQNGKLTESHSSNAATFAVKTIAGNDPSPIDPVEVMFSDGTQLSLTAALSVTIPSTGTLGATSAVPFRLWLVIINDGSTLRLGVRNSSNTAGVYGFPQNGILSSTIITTPNSAGVTYTSVAVTSKQFVIVGFAEYDSGLVTAGTWNASPSRIVLFVPGMPTPGTIVQSVQTSVLTDTANSTVAYVDTGLTATITPNSAANFVQTVWSCNFQVDVANNAAYAALRRGGAVVGLPNKVFSGATNLISTVGQSWMDAPGSAGSLVYTVATKLGSTATAATCFFSSTDAGGALELAEIMG